MFLLGGFGKLVAITLGVLNAMSKDLMRSSWEQMMCTLTHLEEVELDINAIIAYALGTDVDANE